MTVLRTVYINGLGLMAPGLAGWHPSLPVLAGTQPYRPEALPTLHADSLPANERRRTSQLIKLVIQAAQDAITPVSGQDSYPLYPVFASSGGDYEIIDKLCTALAQPDKRVSPIHFHNSVHNAPAGYWAIATKSHLPSISLAAYDETFSAGLLEAVTFAIVERAAVLLIAYDYPPPFPLSEMRTLTAPFAVAMQLNPDRTHRSLAHLTLELTDTGPVDRLKDIDLENLRLTNPAARSLPLLQALAQNTARQIALPYLSDKTLIVNLSP